MTAGADRVMSIDLHAAQAQGFFDGPVDHLWAMPVLVDYVRGRIDLKNVAVVSPDAGRIRVAEKWAAKLGNCPLAFVHKTRDTSRPNVAVANRVVGDVAGRQCVLVDDLIDTGGTIAEAVKVLYKEGAKDVIVAATHGVLSDPAPEILEASKASEVIVTDTLPISENKRFEQLTVLPIAPLLARGIFEVFEDGSVTSMFDGVA
jgi:ribose-phosphate pyrophosphokinase